MALAWRYNQSRDPRWRLLSPDTANGACFALSVQFIICAGTGTNFVNWLKPPELVAEGGLSGDPGVGQVFYRTLADRMLAQREAVGIVIARMAEQSRRVAEGGELGSVAKYNYAVELITSQSPLRPVNNSDNLAFAPLPRKRRTSVATIWAEQIARQAGLKYISISALSGPASSGHGIAAFVQGGRYGIFDPNFGIFSSNSEADFAEDLRDVLETRYEQAHKWVITDINFATFA